MNKRTKLDTLSGQVKDLNDHTMLLQQENDSLKRENSQLKNEVIYLKKTLLVHTAMVIMEIIILSKKKNHLLQNQLARIQSYSSYYYFHLAFSGT